MVHEWEKGFVGNNPGRIAGLARRETLGQVLVRAFGAIAAHRERDELIRAA